MNKVYKSLIKSHTQSKVDRYKAKHAEYKKKCTKAKIWSWRDLQQNMGSISDMNMFPKIVQSTTKVSLETLQKGNGKYALPGEDTD